MRRILAELRHSERGIALPMALMLTVLAMGFAAVPIVAAVGSQEGGSRSQGGNEALAAAEAGAELAVLRQSAELSKTTNTTTPSCASGSTYETSIGWCSKYPATPEPFGSAKYQYQVRPCYKAAENACSGVERQLSESCKLSEQKDLVQVVSTGYAFVAGREVTRRVQIAACAKAINPALATKQTEKTEAENKRTTDTTKQASDEQKLTEKEKQIETKKTEPGAYEEVPGAKTVQPPPNVWGAGQVIGIEYVKMNNNAQVLNGGVGSNGPITASGSANVCGTVNLGGSTSTFTTDNSSSASAPSGCSAGRTVAKSSEKYIFPAVTLPSDIATNNSNGRICAEAECHSGLDPVGSGVYQRGNISWNASNKSLSINYNQLTLEGTAPYYLCQLILAGGSSLYSSTSHGVKIYFAPPSSCPGLNGAAQLQIANGTYIYGDGNHGPLFLFVGSTTAGTSKIELAGGSRSQQFVIYAPYSQIIGNNGIVMTGAMIGNTVELAGGAKINEGGVFTPPAAETFLPSEERTGPSEKKPGSSLTQLEKEREELKTEIAKDKTTVTEDNAAITKKTEEEEKIKAEGGASAQPLSRKAFVQCSSAAPATGESPGKGC